MTTDTIFDDFSYDISELSIQKEWDRLRQPVIIPVTDEAINEETITNCLLLGGWVFEVESNGKESFIFHYERDYNTYHISDNTLLSNILNQKILYTNACFHSVKHDIISDLIANDKVNFDSYNDRLVKGNTGVSIKKVYYMKKNKEYSQEVNHG